MDAVVADSLSDFRMYLDLMAVAAGLALVLVLTGIYAVVSRVAAARTRECAIRMALGADRARVVGLILGNAARLTGIGLGAGMLVAFAGGRVVQTLPVSVRPPDVVTAVPTAIFIGTLAIVACLVPALRAAAADPIEALRSE
jgi:putative ABC transport system permease protein